MQTLSLFLKRLRRNWFFRQPKTGQLRLKLFTWFLLLLTVGYMSLGGFLFLVPAQAQEVETGSIEIWKEAFTIDDISFEFSGDLGDFSLDPNTKTKFDDLSPGVYTVTETAKAGWYLQKIYVVGDLPTNSVADLAGRSVEVHLDPGEHVVLKFLNQPRDEEPEPELGSITVNKYLDADGEASTTDDRSLATESVWTFHLSDGNSTSTQQAFDGSTTFNNLATGTYMISEEVADGYLLIAPENNLREVELSEGENAEVDFVNYLREPDVEPGTSTIKIIKYLDMDGLASTTLDRVLATSSVWNFDLTGTATSSQGTDMGSTTFTGLSAGNYTLSEQIPPGFGLLSPAENNVLVVLAEDDNMELEFINYRLSEPGTGSLTVRKYQDSDGLASTTDDRSLVSSVWTFNVGNGVATTSQQTVNGITTFLDLSPGEYTVSENLLSGWTFVDPASGWATTTIATNTEQFLDFVNYQEPTPPGGGGGGGGGSSSSGGGGGGGSSFIPTLSVSNGQSDDNGCDYIIISWLSSKEASSRLIYDTVSHPNIVGESAPNYGYQDSTAEDPTLETGHQVSILGLNSGDTYYVRPVSRTGSTEAVGDEIEINTLAGSNCVLGETGEARLTLDKEFVNNVVPQGEQDIEFVLTVTNVGNLTAFNVIVSDFLPDGFTFSDTGLEQKMLNIGDLTAGDSEVLSWFLDADAEIPAGLYTNDAQAESDNTDTVQAEDDITIQAGAVLAESGFDPSEFSLLGLVLLGISGSSLWMRRRYT